MVIHFKKDSDRNFILHCVRDDGTETYQKYQWGAFQVEHDIMHYVVETTLGYKHAFYGILASGKDISWFNELRDEDKKSNGSTIMNGEAVQAEMMVIALQTMRDDDELFSLAPAMWQDSKVQPYSFTREQVVAIRARTAELVEEWNASKEGITVSF
jgi:hypothetical protein